MAAPSINLGNFSNDSVSFLNSTQESSRKPLRKKVSAKPSSMFAGLLDMSISFLTQKYLSLEGDSF